MSSVIKIVTIKPGESFILPPDATIKNVSGLLSSSNCTLPEASDISCYYFQYELEGPNSGSDAWENGEIVEIIINQDKYPINYNGYWTDAPGGLAGLQSLISQIAFIITPTYTVSSVGDARFFRISFKTLPYLASKMFLHLTSSDGTEAYIPALETACS